MSVIMLSKPYNPKKLQFPVRVTDKIDGIAADFYVGDDGKWAVQSRQGKPILSVQHIIDYLNLEAEPDRCWTTPKGVHIIGELYIPNTPFREAGGVIRRKETDQRIKLAVYDYYVEGKENTDYFLRMQDLGKVFNYSFSMSMDGLVSMVPLVTDVYDLQQLEATLEMYEPVDPVVHEGFVLRNLTGEDSYYGVNKRKWGMQKVKPKPTADLMVVCFDEATANKEMTFLGETFQEGDGLRAVGRLNVEYKGEIIGAGAGALTHAERRNLWEEYGSSPITNPLIAEVAYMKDDTYDGLREARFKRWRPDKTEVNYD